MLIQYQNDSIKYNIQFDNNYSLSSTRKLIFEKKNIYISVHCTI